MSIHDQCVLVIALIVVAVISFIAGVAQGERRALVILKSADANLDAAKDALTAAVRLRENAEGNLAEADRLHEQISSMLKSQGQSLERS